MLQASLLDSFSMCKLRMLESTHKLIMAARHPHTHATLNTVHTIMAETGDTRTKPCGCDG